MMTAADDADATAGPIEIRISVWTAWQWLWLGVAGIESAAADEPPELS